MNRKMKCGVGHGMTVAHCGLIAPNHADKEGLVSAGYGTRAWPPWWS